MKRYKDSKSKLIKKPECGEDAFGLKDSKYHLHAKDINEGYLSIEIETFQEICNHLNIDINSLSEETLFKCYESIYEVVQVSADIGNDIKNEKI